MTVVSSTRFFAALVATLALSMGPGTAVARGQDFASRAPRFLFAPSRGDAVPFEIDVGSSARLSRVISLSIERPTVGRLLREVERQTGLKFYYAPEVLSPDRAVTLRADAISVATALAGILMDAGVDVLMSDGRTIALVKKRTSLVEPLGTITGRVTDEGGELPIASAQIRVEGTALGATSDDSGRYTIRGVPVGEQRVTARRVGYAPMTKSLSVADGRTAQADFALERTPTQLAEVVTTVTGGQARYELGSAVANLRADSVVKDTPLQSLSDLLANRVPGALINTQNGFVGTVSPIRLRGLNSFTVSNNPIVIVDGARIESSATGQGIGGNTGVGIPNGSARLGDLNLNELESVEVVKGPSAATLYGTDAANGVLIVKTKRGQAGRLRWDTYGEIGSLRQGTDLVPIPYRGWGHSPTTGAMVAPCSLTGVAARACVQDSVTRFSPLKNDQTTMFAPGRQGTAGIQASGGSAQFRYMVAGAWEGELGWARMPLVEQQRIKQVQGLASIPDEHLRPNTERKVNLRGNATAGWGTRGEVTLSNALMKQKFRQLNPLTIVNAYTGGGYNDPTYHGYGPSAAPVGDQFQVKTADELTRYISSLIGKYRPVSWLATHATLGIDYSNDLVDNLQMNGQGPPGVNRTGRRVLGSNAITQYTFDAGATGTAAIAASLVSKTSAGLQYNRRSQLYNAQTGTGLPPGSTTMSGAAAIVPTELRADAIVTGAYVEQQFGWRDRLFVTGAVRADGASTFGQDLNTALYPKFGVSWLASEEPGLPRIPGISSLRLRAALGSSGVQPPSTASVTTLALVTGAIGAVTTSGVVPGAFGNPKIGPERQTEFEGGIDLDGWNGRIHTELTGYARKSTDALIQIPIAASAGGGSVYQNLGSVTNRGIEGLLSIRPIDLPAAGLLLTVNGSANRNRLVSTYPDAPPGFFRSFGLLGQRHRVGYPLYGVWQRPILSYADANGDGILTQSEVVVGDTEVYIGPTAATKRLAYGGTLSLWREIVRVTAMFDWQGGSTPLSYDKFIQCGLYLNCAGNVVRGAETFAEQAAVQAYAKTGSQYGFVGDGTFTRFRELTVSARLPRQALRVVRASAASVSLSARNLHVWTNWLAGDPEVNYFAGQDQSLTYSSPPMPRTFIARLNLSF